MESNGLIAPPAAVLSAASAPAPAGAPGRHREMLAGSARRGRGTLLAGGLLLAASLTGLLTTATSAAAGPAPIPLTSASCPTDMQQGEIDGCVTQLQDLLNNNGAGLGVDGNFGPATFTAVQNYQSGRGLGVDGIVGPATKAALDAASPPPPPPPPPSGGLGPNIATIAGQELNNPAHNHESGGYNCNYYSGALGVGGSCANGWRTEEWCADFATWVWRHAGANTGGLNPGAISFYNYGISRGTWHTSSPRVGDAVVFNVSGGSASHVGLVVSTNGNSFSMISGNSYNPGDGQDDAITQTNLSVGSGGVSGFASPVH